MVLSLLLKDWISELVSHSLVFPSALDTLYESCTPCMRWGEEQYKEEGEMAQKSWEEGEIGGKSREEGEKVR